MLSLGIKKGGGPRFMRDAFGATIIFYAGWKLHGLVLGVAVATLWTIAVYLWERRHGRPGLAARIGLAIALAQAVVGLATQPAGFSLAELAEAVRARTAWGPKKYSARQAAYDLAKLRGKQLARRKDKSRRYMSDPSGVRTMCAYLLLREKVIKPLLG